MTANFAGRLMDAQICFSGFVVKFVLELGSGGFWVEYCRVVGIRYRVCTDVQGDEWSCGRLRGIFRMRRQIGSVIARNLEER